jgi:hypothetical protein
MVIKKYSALMEVYIYPRFKHHFESFFTSFYQTYAYHKLTCEPPELAEEWYQPMSDSLSTQATASFTELPSLLGVAHKCKVTGITLLLEHTINDLVVTFIDDCLEATVVKHFEKECLDNAILLCKNVILSWLETLISSDGHCISFYIAVSISSSIVII